MSTFLTYLFALGIVAPVQPAPTAQMLVSTAELAALLNDPRVVVLHVAVETSRTGLQQGREDHQVSIVPAGQRPRLHHRRRGFA